MKFNCCFFKTIISLIFIAALFSNNSYGQSYGLGFYSHEVVQDKRTSLDLSPGKTFSFKDNFDISFDLSFYTNRQIYFGYIIRIIENDSRNIDLVYNAQAIKNHFNLVVGDKLTQTAFDIDSARLYYQWNTLKIKFDLDHDRLILTTGGKIFVESGVHLKRSANYKILFGVNNYKQFQTTDIPPMRLRNVNIRQNGTLKYNWPLGNEYGLSASETVTQTNGAVNNPLWITALHHDWQAAPVINLNGIASVGFDPKKQALYVIGADSLYTYSINKGQWSSSVNLPGRLVLNQGNQTVFDPYNNSLYNFYIDNHFISKYNFAAHSWDKKFVAGPVTSYWHLNKDISLADTSIYFFGGYGHLLYKNIIEQYSINSNSWRTVKPMGDFFMPRYLAALGATPKGDTVYIMGGYGSASGQQILNPKNLYDMMRFTVKDKTFKKMFTLKEPGEDFAMANSMVIDTKANMYYSLIFPQHKYNSTLQLICGSLNGPGYKAVGNAIPYSFHDTHSFADLYYDARAKKFIAVTLLRSDNNQTRVSIYTLLSPPYPVSPATPAPKTDYFIYIKIAVAVSICGLLVLIYLRHRKKPIFKSSVPSPTSGAMPEAVTTVNHELADTSNKVKAFSGDNLYKNSIFLFGELQVFDTEGVDITKYFTPLIKELFLVILLYSVRRGRGLSSEKLNEILWYDKDAKSARNNRSVNIAKLKNLLDKLGYCTLSKDTGYWKIEVDHDHIYLDYQYYLGIVRDKGLLDIDRIKLLSQITQRGNFLVNNEYEWLDSFKSEISNEVIDTYLHYAHALNLDHTNAELIIEIAGYIFYFDPVNEDATILKCRALSVLGKHSLARNTYENFIKEYKTIYGEDFQKDFHSLLQPQPSKT